MTRVSFSTYLLRRRAMRRHVLYLVACLVIPLVVAGAGHVSAETRPPDHAHFTVTDRVINPDLRPFTATVGRVGNGFRLVAGSGFEPAIYRTQFLATGGGKDRILAHPSTLSQWDSLSTGALDGAAVEILRIENGAFRSVRQDRVARGGHSIDGWFRMHNGRAVAPGQNSYVFAWQRVMKPGARYYLTVSAIDDKGDLSAPSDPVSVVRPAQVRKAGGDNEMKRIKTSDRRSSRLAAPENLTVVRNTPDGAKVRWEAVPGAKGYAVFYSHIAPEKHRGFFLELVGQGPEIENGDLVILRHRFDHADRSMLSNRIWDAPFARKIVGTHLIRTWPGEPGHGEWQLIEHDENTVVEGAGETHLRVSLNFGDKIDIGDTNHAGTDGDWYPVLDPGHVYRIEFWARGKSAFPVQFEMGGPYAPGKPGGLRPIHFALTPEWQKHEARFQVPFVLKEKRPGKMLLRLRGPGQVDIDNLRIYRDDAPFLALTPDDSAEFLRSGMGALRTHALIKTGVTTYDLAQLTNPPGGINTESGYTLPAFLAMAADHGIEPWLQIEPHLTRAEWLGLAEFLAAPFDPKDPGKHPWAAKRHAQGRTAPWTESFDRILFEIGNETWNRLFSPWTFAKMQDVETGRKYSRGEVYGLYQEYVLGLLQESPHWPELAGRLIPVLGGWAANDYGLKAASVSPSSRILTHAGYIGGWDENEGAASPTSQGFSSILTHTLQTTLPRAKRFSEGAEQVARARGTPLELGTYEAGPGYALNGLNGQKVSEEAAVLQELAMKSVAAGTATLDAFLANASEGFTLQNFFTFGHGTRWTSHSRWDKGGNAYPAWRLLSLFNTEALGDMLAVQTIRVPTIDLPESRRREAVKNGPLVAVYATRNADRLTAIVISRRVPGFPVAGDDGHGPVSIDLPIRHAEKLTIYRLDGAYDRHGVSSSAPEVEAISRAVPTTLPRLEVPDLPPGNALFFVFDGVG